MEDFVPFEIANKLKKKGFNEKTFGFYSFPLKLPQYPITYVIKNYNKKDNFYSAPTISQVLRWLREHNIHIVVFINDDTDNPVTYEIYKGTECVMYEHKYYSLSEWNNAEIDAIEYVLDNLI